MSYEVDPKTLLFRDDSITWEEARELFTFCQRIVLEGHVYCQHPAFLAWSTAAGFAGGPNELLAYATAFPQRALLSLTRLLIPRMPLTPGW